MSLSKQQMYIKKSFKNEHVYVFTRCPSKNRSDLIVIFNGTLNVKGLPYHTLRIPTAFKRIKVTITIFYKTLGDVSWGGNIGVHSIKYNVGFTISEALPTF